MQREGREVDVMPYGGQRWKRRGGANWRVVDTGNYRSRRSISLVPRPCDKWPGYEARNLPCDKRIGETLTELVKKNNN